MTIKTWSIEEQTGYKPITTYFEDFSIAENFGAEAIKITFDVEMEEDSYARSNYKIFTEFVMVLNWKIWQWYKTDERIARLYNSLWEKAEQYVQEHFNEEELSYFYRTTD